MNELLSFLSNLTDRTLSAGAETPWYNIIPPWIIVFIIVVGAIVILKPFAEGGGSLLLSVSQMIASVGEAFKTLTADVGVMGKNVSKGVENFISMGNTAILAHKEIRLAEVAADEQSSQVVLEDLHGGKRVLLTYQGPGANDAPRELLESSRGSPLGTGVFAASNAKMLPGAAPNQAMLPPSQPASKLAFLPKRSAKAPAGAPGMPGSR